MPIVEKAIQILDEQLILTNKRAVYWEAKGTLILSDLHVGKTAHFRKHGIPIPDDILEEDLAGLSQLIEHFKVESLIVVGDLFHAETNSNMDFFMNWRYAHNTLEVILIKGNHDRLPDKLISAFNLRIASKLELGPFVFVHDPEDNTEDKFAVSGHIHPGVLLKGKGKQKVKLPCYVLTQNELILPAFSKFTGLNSRYGNKNAVYFAFTDNEIFKF